MTHSPVALTEPYTSPKRKRDVIWVGSSDEQESLREQRLNEQLKENGLSPVPAQKPRRAEGSVPKLLQMVRSMRRQLDLIETELEGLDA